MKPIFRNELEEAAAFQLSLDYSCRPEDFLSAKNTVTLSNVTKGRREFTEGTEFFRMAVMGYSAVATADSSILEFAKNLLSRYDGSQLFTGKIQYFLNEEMKKYNKIIGDITTYYLPVTPYKYFRRDGFNIRLYEQEEIVNVLYNCKGFSNALMYNSGKKRRDVLAVCALNGDSVVGMAGASSDSERFWQIGVDVLPGYRCMGIGTEIVSALTYEVFMHGAIPYYGTWGGNIASQNTARRCGYVPVWAEMFARGID